MDFWTNLGGDRTCELRLQDTYDLRLVRNGRVHATSFTVPAAARATHVQGFIHDGALFDFWLLIAKEDTSTFHKVFHKHDPPLLDERLYMKVCAYLARQKTVRVVVTLTMQGKSAYDMEAAVDAVLDTGVFQDAINERGDMKVTSALAAMEDDEGED